MVSVIKNTERVGGYGWRGAANRKLQVHEMATYTANYRQSSAAKPFACLVLNRREREKKIFARKIAGVSFTARSTHETYCSACK